MSKITANIDIASATIKVDKNLNEVESGSEYDTLQVSFIVNDDSIPLTSHYSCGFFLCDTEDNIVHEFKFPLAGSAISLTNAANIYETIQVNYNQSYTIKLWAQNNGVRVDKESTFTTSIPPQPYPSWNWSGTAWIPPSPRPTDKKGAAYAWSEKLKKWIELVPPLGQYDDIL